MFAVEGGAPPKIKPVELPVPAAPIMLLPSFILPPVDQAPTGAPAPVHSSTPVGVGLPPAANPAEVLLPFPVNSYLPVLKSFCSAQLVPFHNSVIAAAGSLPNANADVAIPKPPARVLAVFKSFTSVQVVP